MLVNPTNTSRAVSLTLEQFIDGWANALPADEARELYETFRPFTEAKVYTQALNEPLLIFSGERDHTVPWSIAHGWRDVADTALEFIKHHG